MEENMPRLLPVFKGYTVDVRLREFRKFDCEKGIDGTEFIDFDSEEGDKLLSELIRTLDSNDPLFKEIAAAIV